MRIANAIVYALVTALGAIVAAGKVPSSYVEWSGLALAVITAGWGKYTQDPGLLKPNRSAWTDDERRIAAGLPSKRTVAQ